MKIYKLLFLVCFSFVSIYASSQSRVQNQSRSNQNDTANYPYWIDMMQDQDANFFDVQRAAEIYFQNNYKGKGSGWKQYKRWEYFMETRVKPDGSRYAPDFVWNEYNAQAQIDGPASSSGGNWIELGPISMPGNGTSQPNGLGRVNCVAFHPSNSNIIWVGAPSGGLWKSINGGTSWTSSTDNLPTLGVSSIIIDSVNPNIMYIGTGDRDGGDAFGMGVMKSTDGGQNWTMANTGMGNKTVGMMLRHPTNSSILLAATSGGIYKTTNSAASWTKTSSNSAHYKDLRFKPGDPSTVYATSSGDFYLSTNGGNSWTQITSGIPGTGRLVIGVSPANPSYVYALVGGSNGLTGLYRSTNSGQNFSTMSTSPNILGYSQTGSDTRSQASYDLAIAVDPVNINIIYAGGINIWKSTNGGQSWNLNAHWVGSGGVPDVHADIHSLDFSPLNGRLYCGNDGGIYYTINGGTTWPEISSGLAIAQVYKIGQSALAANHIINGYQDNGTAIYSSSGWSTEIGGDGMECAIDPTNSNYIYGALYYGDIRRSSNGGTYFSTIADDGVNGINESGAWVTPYTLHSTNPNTMFVGYKNVWRSTNVKAGSVSSVLWTSISSFGSSNTLRVIEHSPANVNVLYTAASNALYRSDNVNAASPTWTNLSSYLPTTSIPTDIEAHPTNQNIVYMTMSNNVYKSTNKGNSWTAISSNLPNVSINCIVYDTSSNEGLYVGTDIGVYYKDASMSQWIAFSGGLPLSGEITELEIYYNAVHANSRISASTYGRGLWQSDLYTSASTNSINFSASSTIIYVGDSIDFTDNTSPTPSSWYWTFSGGTPSTSNVQNPTSIKYLTAGVYDVKLVATTVNGMDSLVKTNYITVNMPNPYCAATSVTCDEYIGNVSVGSINNTTTCGHYVDYTATHSTNMTIGNSYPLVVTNPVTFSGDQCGVWVDWNQDGDFYDANEAINVSGGPGSFTATVIPPSAAVTGATRMRIRVKYNIGTLDPCGSATYGEVEDYTVVVQSAAASLVVTPSNHNVTDQSGSVQFFIASNVSWSASDNAGWLTLAPASGSGNGSIIASYSANTSQNPRTATITVTGPGVSNQVVTVVQAGITPVLAITPSNQNVGDASGYTAFTVNSNISWSATDNAGWLTLSPTTGSGNGLITATFTANTGTNPRTATITLSGSGVSNQIATVTQAATSAFLTVTPASQSVGDTAGNVSFNIGSNISWSATDNATWLTLNPANGTGNGILTATFTANTNANPRTATVTVTGTGVSNQVVTVTQAGSASFLTVSPTSQTVPDTAGYTSFNITSNVSWSASDNATWLTLNPTTGSNNGILTATYTANTNSSPRTAIITVTGTGVSNQTITITQAGSSLSLVISPSNQNVNAASGSTNFTITSNVAWSATDNATWLSLNPSSANGNGTLTATFTQNTGANPRTATITFTGSGVSNQTVTVTQAGTAPSLAVNPSIQNVASNSGSTSFNIVSNIAWTANSSASWLSLNPSSGTGNGGITATFSANVSANPRTATITVTGNGVPSQAVTVVQAGNTLYLTIAPSNQTVTSAPGNATYTINSNVSWTLTDDQSWLTVTPDSGNGNTTITAAYTANSYSSPRTATISVAGVGISAVQLATLTQASSGPYMIINPANYDVGDTTGTVYFYLSSNANWNAISSANWLSISPTSGFAGDTITAVFSANPNYDARTAYITINAQNVGTQLATVNQEGFGVGVGETALKNRIKIYPNPVKELLYINIFDDNVYELKLYNVLGEVLYLKEFKSFENIDVSKFAGGIYFLEFNKTSGNFERLVTKIVIE